MLTRVAEHQFAAAQNMSKPASSLSLSNYISQGSHQFSEDIYRKMVAVPEFSEFYCCGGATTGFAGTSPLPANARGRCLAFSVPDSSRFISGVDR